MRNWRAVGVCALFFLVAATPVAQATTREYAVTATGVCAPTQASYAAQLKRRPLGILNEGPGFVLVACSLPINTNADYAVTPVPGNGQQLNSIQITFTPFFTDYAFAKNATCNVVAGDRTSWKTYTSGVSLQEGDGPKSLTIEYLDRRTARGSYNVLCQIPTGVEIGTITYSYVDQDGQI